MNKILHIDTDLQFPNRIFKSDTDNKVRQITDKAQNIALVQTDPAKQPVYNYGGYYSFDGVNDVLYNPKMFYDFSKPNYTLFLLVRPTNIAKTQVLMGCRTDVGNTFFTLYQNNSTGLYTAQMRINGTVIYATTQSVPVVENQWNTIVLTVADNQASLIINGKMSGSSFRFTHSGFSIPDLTVAPTHIGNERYREGWYFEGDIAYIKMEQKDYPEWQQRVPNLSKVQFADGATVFDDSFLHNSGFTHFKRYPDNGFNKLFISSKYLKGAVIDSADVVESITPSLSFYSNRMVQSNVLYRPKISQKNGFVFNGAVYQSLYSDFGNEFNTPQTIATINKSQNWVINYWVYRIGQNDSAADIYVQEAGGGLLLRSRVENTTKLHQSNYPSIGKTLTSLAPIPLNKWTYVANVKVENSLYLLVDGILNDIDTTTATGLAEVFLELGSKTGIYVLNGYIDDILFASGEGVLIDPTGFSVGQKVFEPPTRGEFDGTIKQY